MESPNGRTTIDGQNRGGGDEWGWVIGWVIGWTILAPPLAFILALAFATWALRNGIQFGESYPR